MIARFSAGTAELRTALDRLRNRGETDFTRVEPVVREAMAFVKSHGDAGVRDLIRRFEKREPPRELVRRKYDGEKALLALAKKAREALECAAERIRRFHRHERESMSLAQGFRYEEDGVALGLRVRPLARVGVYAPGGKARYPSSVLMSAI